jgi:protein TonB
MRYPEIAQENGIQGKVLVNFTINSLGETSDFRVLKKVDPVLDNEALRVIKYSPLWRPGCVNNIPIRVYFTFPMNFVLQE